MSDTTICFRPPPPRGLAGYALIRNHSAEVLLLEKRLPTHPSERWDLPGGRTEGGDLVPIACQHVVLDQTGLRILPSRLLVVHQTPGRGRAPENTSYVFDGGLARGPVSLAADFAAHRWARPDDIRALVSPSAAWRIQRALDTAYGAPVRYLCGEPRGWSRLAS
ncbi:NUDIX domain-containing protein [Streptomyces sp. 4N509B]|uniref:NUDIX domain-containing protein n=1 Tax=Streptomyces sp. 4N509B TaxID=3457413 RepID=UPI003FD40DC3